MKNTKVTKILFLSADPTDQTRLRLGQEVRDVEERLRLAKLRDNFQIEMRFCVRISDITQAIFDTEPEIVHFSGHGTKGGELCFEDSIGNAIALKKDAITNLFRLLSSQVTCVLLNACYSSQQAEGIAEHIPFVIGMKDTIGDAAAIAFAVGFYKALGGGKGVKEAFNFGVLELDLQNIPEHDTPLFINKNSVKNNTERIVFSESNQRIKTDDWNEIFRNTYNWLLNDQIESGGWGKSQNLFSEKITQRKLTSLEFNEGGIISTFLSLRALKHFDNSTGMLNRHEYVNKAIEYLLLRQSKNGSFGRFIETRVGKELHTSIRHTAFAVAALIDANASPKAITAGVSYLCNNWSMENILEDAAPSLAIAGTIYAIDKFLSTNFYDHFISENENSILKLNVWEQTKNGLLRLLVEMSRSDKRFPFWKPYGNNDLRIFETALVTIDLVSHPLPDILVPTTIDILNSIYSHKHLSALPYGLGSEYPDIGFSSYFLQMIHREDFMGRLSKYALFKELANFSVELEQFMLKEYNNPQYRTYTQGDSFSNLLLMYNRNQQLAK